MKDLLNILENNARISLEDLSVMLNQSTEETAKQIDQAVNEGYIRGFQTLIDWDKAKINRVEAFIELHVSPKKSRGFDEIAQTIAEYEEVDSVYLMSGGYDLLVTIHGQSFQEIAFFVAQRLSTLDDVLTTSTGFLLKTYKRAGQNFSGMDIDEREKFLL